MDVDDKGKDADIGIISSTPPSPSPSRVRKDLSQKNAPLEMDSINNNPCMSTIVSVRYIIGLAFDPPDWRQLISGTGIGHDASQIRKHI